jgi:hypothetical protein
MKKTLILVLVLAFIPLLSFADLGLGASAFLNNPVLIGQDADASELRDGGFTFGADARFKLSILQLEALGLLSMGDDVTSIDLYADAGLALDLAFLRLSLGAGPTLFFVLNDSTGDDILAGYNVKANADIKLGRISFGLSYIMGLIVEDGLFNVALNKSTGMLGANVLFWF